tara:strand:- start:794 stop:1804 length:1011 start_codon:yes stop_codon:yes gene_type:complete
MNEKPLDYVQIDSRIRKHPKVRAFAASIGDIKHGHNYFVNMLCEVGVFHPTGKITPADSAYVAELCLWEGDPEKLLAALVKAELIAINRRFSNHVVEIPGWDKRSGAAIKKREYCRQRRAGKKNTNSSEVLAWSDEPLSESRKEYANRSRRVRESDNRDRDRDTIYKGGKKKKGELKLSEEERTQAMEVYSHWSQYHPHAAHQPSDTTLSYVVRNLRLGRSVEQLNRCVDGYHYDKFLKDNPSCLNFSWMFLNDERVVGGLERRDKQKPLPKAPDPSDEKRDAVRSILIDYGALVGPQDLTQIVEADVAKDRIEEALESLALDDRTGPKIKEALNV